MRRFPRAIHSNEGICPFQVHLTRTVGAYANLTFVGERFFLRSNLSQDHGRFALVIDGNLSAFGSGYAPMTSAQMHDMLNQTIYASPTVRCSYLGEVTDLWRPVESRRTSHPGASVQKGTCAPCKRLMLSQIVNLGRQGTNASDDIFALNSIVIETRAPLQKPSPQMIHSTFLASCLPEPNYMVNAVVGIAVAIVLGILSAYALFWWARKRCGSSRRRGRPTIDGARFSIADEPVDWRVDPYDSIYLRARPTFRRASSAGSIPTSPAPTLVPYTPVRTRSDSASSQSLPTLPPTPNSFQLSLREETQPLLEIEVLADHVVGHRSPPPAYFRAPSPPRPRLRRESDSSTGSSQA